MRAAQYMTRDKRWFQDSLEWPEGGSSDFPPVIIRVLALLKERASSRPCNNGFYFFPSYILLLSVT